MKTVIVGATGYGGVELIRLLLNHPYFEVNGLITSSKSGKQIKQIYPHLKHVTKPLEQLELDVLCDKGDVIFFATPPGVSSEWAPQLVEQGKIVIDLAGDFRLHSSQLYQEWYQRPAAPQQWLDQAVYGLSEWYQTKIATAQLIANPGCYPTATLLALIPLLRAGWLSPHSLIIDAKSGVTGAGRSSKQSMIYSELNDNLLPYKVDGHQHIPEIEQYATQFAEQKVKVNFIPHLVPMNRGILVTIYADQLPSDVNEKKLAELYHETYQKAPFVRVMESGWPQTKHVQGSNFCDIGFHLDQRTGRFILLAAIDNLVKGAAGQAVQNANIRMGYPEQTGLTALPIFP